MNDLDHSQLIADLGSLLTDAPDDSIISRTFCRAPAVKAVLFAFAPGQELSEHQSSLPAVLHLLEGEADVTLGQEASRLQAGAWAYMPPALPHSVKAITPLRLLLLLLGSERGG